MDKYRKKTLIEVVDTYFDGSVWVQAEGDSTNRWMMSKEFFDKNYESVKEVQDER